MTEQSHRYSACGLEIESAFPITHLPPGNGQFPDDLKIVAGSTSPELEWDIATPQWRACSSSVQLDGMHGESCICSAGDEICFYGIAPELDETFTLLGRALAVICMQRGLPVFHAAVLEKDGRALAIAGRSGAGKSTLAMEFLRRGYRIVADDIAACHIAEGKLVARPLYPMTRRLAQEEGEGWKMIPGLPKQVSIDVPFCAEARTLEHLFVVSLAASGEGEVEIARLAEEERPAALERQMYRRGIARHIMGFNGLRLLLSRVADGLPISRVKRPVGCDPVVLADHIEKSLVQA